MNIPQNIHKIQKRNSSPSPFNINMIPSLNSLQNNNNTSFINQNNIDYSYSNSSQSNDLKETQCPNCLSYQRNLNEKKILIQKLQNQINKITSSNTFNNQINSYKKTIANLKNEIENKSEEISLLKLSYDERLNALLIQNSQLEEELENMKKNNMLLNKANIKMQKLNKYKDNEINQYKEKVKQLLNKINLKNEDINKIKGQAKNIIDNLNNKYNNLSSNYNSLALSSGGSQLIKYNHQKAKTNIESDLSNYEEDQLADILIKTGKRSSISKSKSQKINYDSGSENNILNLNKKLNKFSANKERVNTPKMSSTQSSWMISPAQRELMLFHKKNDTININNGMEDNLIKDMNKKLIIKNEKLIEENVELKNNLAEFQLNNQSLKQLLNRKNNEIIKYQRDCINKKNQIEKLKSASKSFSTKKIPFCPSTIPNNKKNNTINVDNSTKMKSTTNKIKDFSEYDLENENEEKKKVLNIKNYSNDLIDDSDNEDEKEKFELKSNKSSSNLKINKDNILINKDAKINLLNSKLSEKIKMIKNLELKINELKNQNKYANDLKLNKEELEIKLKKYINENNDLLKKIESKNNLIKEKDLKIENLKISLEEKDSINLKNEQNKNYEKLLLQKNYLENINKDQKKLIDERDELIKEKDDNIIFLQNKIESLNESINNLQNDINSYQNETYLLKDKNNKYDNDINIKNNELIKLRKKLDEEKTKYEKEIELLKLDLNKNKNEYDKIISKYNGEKDEIIKEKINLELKIKKYEDILTNEKTNKIKDKDEKEKMKNEINELNSELNEKEIEIKKLKKELELKEQIKNVEINTSINKSISEEIKDKDNEIQKQNEIIVNLKKENDNLSKELHDAKLSLKITTDIKENLDRQIDELNEDIEGQKEKIENLEKEKNNSREKFDKILEEKNNLNNQLNEIKTEFDKEKIISNDKDKKIKISDNNIKELNTLIDTINKEKERIYKENKTLLEEIKSLKEKIDSTQKNIQEQEKENNILKADKSKMILRLSSLNEEKLKLKQSLNVFESNNEENNKQISKLKEEIKNKEKIITQKSNENEKINEEILLLKQENESKDKIIKTNEEKLKSLKEELEEKTTQLENTIKNINDYEIQIKGLKDEKQELITKNKNYGNDLKEKENKFNDIKKENDILKEENKKLIEIKNKLNNENINKDFFVEMDESQMQKEEELNKLRENVEELNNNLNIKNQECEKYKNLYLEMKNKVDKMTLELRQKFENNNTNNNTVNNQTEKTLNDKDTEMSSLETEYKEIVKENINLKVKINQLNEEITTLKSENESQKKNLISKETELNNMKEISKAMIEKEKKKLEEEQNIEPSNTTIISSKNHKKLTWYLIFKYNKNNPKNESQKPDENNYSNYIWVTGNVIRREKLKKFNTFEDDEKKIMELQQYVFDLQKKLEKKEESISKLDYKNKKLNEQIQNKTAGVKGGDFVLSRISDTDKNKVKNNFANSISSNDGGINDVDKYKKILEQLNDSNKRELILHNEIKELKTKLKKKEEFESGTQDLKNIDKSIDSGFLDEDFKQSHNEGVFNFIKESQNQINNNKNKEVLASVRSDQENINAYKNDTFNYKEAEKKADEFLREGLGDDSEYSEFKQMQKQMTFIKKQLKETLQKYEQLSDQVKELLKNVKCDIKIKPQISQICQILGFSPNTTARIISNKKTGIFGLLSGKK